MSLPRASRGFTLFEIVVVLAIVGLATGLVALGVRHMLERDLGAQAERSLAWLQSLSDRAVLEGTAYGVAVEDNQLRAYTWFDGQWLQVEYEDSRALPEQISFQLLDAEGKPLDTPGQSSSSRQQADKPPLVFLPNGFALTGGGLELAAGDGAERIEWKTDQAPRMEGAAQ